MAPTRNRYLRAIKRSVKLGVSEEDAAEMQQWHDLHLANPADKFHFRQYMQAHTVEKLRGFWQIAVHKNSNRAQYIKMSYLFKKCLETRRK